MESERTLRQAGRIAEADRLYGNLRRSMALGYLASEHQFVADRIFPIVTDRPQRVRAFERDVVFLPAARFDAPAPIAEAKYTTREEYINKNATFAEILAAERAVHELCEIHHDLERNSDQQLYRCQACGYTADCVDTMTGHRVDGTCNWRIRHARYAGSDARRDGRAPEAQQQPQQPPHEGERKRPAKARSRANKRHHS